MKMLQLKGKNYRLNIANVKYSTLLLTIMLSLNAFSATVSLSVKQTIENGLNKGPNKLPIKAVFTTPVPNLFKVTTTDNKTFYSTANGQFVISGEMYEVTSSDVISLAERSSRQQRIKQINRINDSDTIIYPAIGNKRYRLTIFTDVDCPYCAKLHAEISTLNQKGIEVVYMAFPRAGINSPSFEKIASVWCSNNPKDNMALAQLGKLIEVDDCDDTAIKQQFTLGNNLGIQGTPSIIFENGKLLSGYYSANELLAIISP